MSARARRRSAAVVVALVLAGAACAVLVSGTLGQVLAFVLIAVGLVLATGWAFFEVGLSEDRERAARDRPPAPPARGRLARGRSPRPRLPRSDGHRRRL